MLKYNFTVYWRRGWNAVTTILGEHELPPLWHNHNNSHTVVQRCTLQYSLQCNRTRTYHCLSMLCNGWLPRKKMLRSSFPKLHLQVVSQWHPLLWSRFTVHIRVCQTVYYTVGDSDHSKLHYTIHLGTSPGIGICLFRRNGFQRMLKSKSSFRCSTAVSSCFFPTQHLEKGESNHGP